MKTNNIKIGFESLKDMNTTEVLKIESKLKDLERVREQSTDKQFINDSYQYEEDLNEELRRIKEKGLSNNREVRNKDKLNFAERLISDLE